MKRYGIVQYSHSRITDLTASELSRELRAKVKFLGPLGDPLYEGPHHLDLDVQDAMRTAYFRRHTPDTRVALSYLEFLKAGDELVLRATQELPSCLSMIWLLDWLQARRAPMGRVSLVVDPEPVWSPRSPEHLRELFSRRMPVADVVVDLVQLRRQIASPEWDCRPDFGNLLAHVRSWAHSDRALEGLLA